MHRVKATLMAVVIVALLQGTAAADVGDVVVGGVLVLRIRAEAGGLTIQQRAAIVEQRIVNVLGKVRPTPEQIVVRIVNGQPAIFVGPAMIITVDANHARLNQTTQQALAEVWAGKLREALPKAMPQVRPTGP